MKKACGFTLIELIIVIVLIGILGSLMISKTVKGYFTVKNINDMVNATYIATDNLMRELKGAANITSLGTTTLTFLNQQGQTIVIDWDLSAATLRRNVDGAGPQTLCHQVISIAFAYFDEALASTAVASNVRFLTMQMTTMNTDGLSYPLMAGTVLRKRLH